MNLVGYSRPELWGAARDDLLRRDWPYLAEQKQIPKKKKETARNCAELSWAEHIGNVLNMFLWLWSATFGQNLGLNYLRKIKDVSNEAWSDVAELKLGWLKYNPWIFQ